MRPALPVLLIALAGACATETPPQPAEQPAEPPAAATPPPEAPAIETTSTAPAAPPPAAPLSVALPPETVVQALPVSLSREQIDKTFSFHRRYFNRLYAERVKARRQLKGTMLVSFLINADGSTRDATLVESNLGDRPFEQEILKQIGQTNFPPATGSTPVDRYPLEFSLQPK